MFCETWNELERLCINEPHTFMNQLPNIGYHLLNYEKRTERGTINLFGIAIREKNYDLVKSMLSCDLISSRTLNQQTDGFNPFTLACMTSVEIAFLMLNSNKILSSTINDLKSFHPFKCLISANNTNPEYSNKIENFKLAMSSDKFLKECSHTEMCIAFHGLLMGVGCPQAIDITMSNDKLTSEMIEQFKFNGKTIFELYCCKDGKALKILLDSDKVSMDFATSACRNLNIDLYNSRIQNILKSHEKTAHLFQNI